MGSAKIVRSSDGTRACNGFRYRFRGARCRSKCSCVGSGKARRCGSRAKYNVAVIVACLYISAANNICVGILTGMKNDRRARVATVIVPLELEPV